MINLVDLLNQMIPKCDYFDGDVYPFYHASLPDGSELWFEPTGYDGWEMEDSEDYVKEKLGEQVFTAQLYRSYVVNGDPVYAPLLYLGYTCEPDTVSNDSSLTGASKMPEGEVEPWGNGHVTEAVVYGGEMQEKNGLIDGKYDLYDCIHCGFAADEEEQLAITHWVKVDRHTSERKVVPGYIDRLTNLLLSAIG